MKPDQKATCPSAEPKAGAVLLGVVKQDGEVALLSQRIEIDEHFIETASQGRDLGQRFRFASPCAAKGCANWSGHHCMVLDIARQLAHIEPHVDELLPACSIRTTCRWFMQEGGDACRICPKINTGFAEVETV
ncbi:hypothetical protein FHS57_003322 [Runella defluvii]|uniref:Nitrogen fixation protein n=1 Tax=Runella defluvii TaxID=370973 RepID=A0A7W5ZLR4_9BACT|nr:hypothetical protein [Runella defluvii]MBB3839316.1 hypothetical protein [Runella defluvii]